MFLLVSASSYIFSFFMTKNNTKENNEKRPKNNYRRHLIIDIRSDVIGDRETKKIPEEEFSFDQISVVLSLSSPSKHCRSISLLVRVFKFERKMSRLIESSISLSFFHWMFEEKKNEMNRMIFARKMIDDMIIQELMIISPSSPSFLIAKLEFFG